MNYYNILGVSRSASDEEIKTAYRNMIKAFHPDYYKGNPEFANKKTIELNEAYEVLKNPQSRKEYDQMLKNKVNYDYKSSYSNSSSSTTQSSKKSEPKIEEKAIEPSGGIYNYIALFVGLISYSAAMIIFPLIVAFLWRFPFLQGWLYSWFAWPEDSFLTLVFCSTILATKLCVIVETTLLEKVINKKKWAGMATALIIIVSDILSIINLVINKQYNLYDYLSLFFAIALAYILIFPIGKQENSNINNETSTKTKGQKSSSSKKKSPDSNTIKASKIFTKQHVVYLAILLAILCTVGLLSTNSTPSGDKAISIPEGCEYTKTQVHYYKCDDFEIYYSEKNAKWNYNIFSSQQKEKEKCTKKTGCTVLRATTEKINGFQSFKYITSEKKDSSYQLSFHYFIELESNKLLDLRFVKTSDNSYDSNFENTIKNILKSLHN